MPNLGTTCHFLQINFLVVNQKVPWSHYADHEAAMQRTSTLSKTSMISSCRGTAVTANPRPRARRIFQQSEISVWHSYVAVFLLVYIAQILLHKVVTLSRLLTFVPPVPGMLPKEHRRCLINSRRIGLWPHLKSMNKSEIRQQQMFMILAMTDASTTAEW